MTRIISVVNQKGGSGKSTLASNLATCLAAAGFKTISIELDEQATSTRQLLATDTPKAKLAAYINKTATFDDCLEEGRIPNLWVMAPGPVLLIAV